MEKILIPLDGSAFAEQAVETARAIAHRTGAAIEFVSVQPPAVPPSRVSGAPPLDPRFDAELRRSLQAYLDRIVEAERARSTFSVSGRLREGGADREIVAQAEESSADLIAMTTHGRGGLGLWLGSVADRVIRAAHVPVLLVRQDESGEGREVHLRRVVIGAAGADADDRIVTAVEDVAGLADVEFTLVHVVDRLPMIPAVDPAVGPPPDELAGLPTTRDQQRWDDAERYLEWIAGPLRARGATVATRVVRSASAPGAIVDAAVRANADLIAVGTAARAPVARWFLGSTSDKVVRSASCSVLVCPPERETGEELRL